MAEQAEREQRRRASGVERLRAPIERERGAGRPRAACRRRARGARDAVAERHRAALDAELSADEAVGAESAAELRRCAQQETELQARLRGASEALTQAEVARAAGARRGRRVGAAAGRSSPGCWASRPSPPRSRSARRSAPSSRRGSSASPAGASSWAR